MSDTRDNPGIGGKPVTPSATQKIGARFLYIGVSGNVVISFPGNPTPVPYQNVPVGIFPFEADYLLPDDGNGISTTASAIVANY